MQVGMIIGVSIVTLVIALTALISGLGVRSTRDFTVAGKRAGWPIVSGIIVGALVGGSSTVGTAQAAFVYGLPAWWFKLGAGLGCMVLGTVFVQQLRRTGVETLPQYLVASFGQPIRPYVAICDSIGIFITIPGQAASAITLLAVLLHWSLPPVVVLVALLIVLGALVCGMVTDIVWNLMVAPGGAAVFIGLVGSLFGLFAGHAISGAMGARKTPTPSVVVGE